MSQPNNRLGIGGHLPSHPASLASWQRHLGRERPVHVPALRRWLASGTVASLAPRAWSRDQGRKILQIDGREASGAELLTWSTEVARLLIDSDVAPGGRVLVALPTSLELVACYLGILRAGMVALLVNPSFTRPEFARVIADAGASFGFVAPAVGDLIGGAGRRSFSFSLVDAPARPQAVVGVWLGEQPTRSERGDLAVRMRRAWPGDESVLAYTSGSTGEPKGVPLTHANLLSSARGVMSSWRWTRNDVVVHCLPLYHQHGLSSIHAMVLGGGRTVIRSRFEPEEFSDLVAAERPTIMLGVPAIYRRLVDAAPRRERFVSLRLLVSGSAPLPPVLAESIEESTGQVPLERYGTTESGLDLSNLYDGERRKGAVGYALPGVEVCVGNVSDGHRVDEAPTGVDGEILVRGPQVVRGYWRQADDDPGVFASGGWFRTGDIGRVDPCDGSFSITGRAKEVIISGGMNVYPREVELVLEQHGDVLTVAVAGIPSGRWGEAVCAFMVARPGRRPDTQELASLCRDGLAPYKHPKRFVLVDEIPRNAMGKIQRDRLPSLLDDADELR